MLDRYIMQDRRYALGYTQSQMARFLGISRSYYQALELGTRPLTRELQYAVACELGLSMHFDPPVSEPPKAAPKAPAASPYGIITKYNSGYVGVTQ